MGSSRGSVYAESDEDSTSAHGGTDRSAFTRRVLCSSLANSDSDRRDDPQNQSGRNQTRLVDSTRRRQAAEQVQTPEACPSPSPSRSPILSSVFPISRTNSTNPRFAAGVQLTSHPLSKTLSAPSTPLSSSFPISRPQPQLLSQPPRPPSAPMIQRNSLPTKQPAKQPSKQPARPRPPPPPAGSDRPDSDSSAEDDSADERPVQVARKAPKKSQQFGQGPNARGPHPLAKGEFFGRRWKCERS